MHDTTPTMIFVLFATDEVVAVLLYKSILTFRYIKRRKKSYSAVSIVGIECISAETFVGLGTRMGFRVIWAFVFNVLRPRIIFRVGLAV